MTTKEKSAQRQLILAVDAAGRPVERESTPPHGLGCSFCGKSASEVKQLHQGPGVAICDECVSICAEIQNNDQS